MALSSQQMVKEAEAQIETLDIDTALARLDDDNYTFVDIRDVRELWREGKIQGATHAPRGMLEFWIDPESPYHREVFASGKTFVFYCASAWRSALAALTAQNMGLKTCHIAGGFTAWKTASGPIEAVEPKH
ncbi:MAG: rhodanese-like domain-containing protein [Pseudomonadales bacterium]